MNVGACGLEFIADDVDGIVLFGCNVEDPSDNSEDGHTGPQTAMQSLEDGIEELIKIICMPKTL